MTGIPITKCYHGMHAAHGIQTCLFPVEGRLQRTLFLCKVDERPRGKCGVNCVAHVVFREQNESHSLLFVLIAAESIMNNSL